MRWILCTSTPILCWFYGESIAILYSQFQPFPGWKRLKLKSCREHTTSSKPDEVNAAASKMPACSIMKIQRKSSRPARVPLTILLNRRTGGRGHPRWRTISSWWFIFATKTPLVQWMKALMIFTACSIIDEMLETHGDSYLKRQSLYHYYYYSILLDLYCASISQ